MSALELTNWLESIRRMHSTVLCAGGAPILHTLRGGDLMGLALGIVRGANVMGGRE